MDKRLLGQTGISVSPLGLGTVKFGRNEGVKYPAQFSIPEERDLADLLSLARELGINLLDTAPAYGASEERLGRLLKGQRQDWVIAGKAGEDFENGQSSYDFSAAHFEASLMRSLDRLQTDYLDILLIHSDGCDLEILRDDDLIKALEEFKQRGLVRAIGASTKTLEGGLKALDLLDVVMATYNPDYTEEATVLGRAAEMGKGTLIKKGFASGHFSQKLSTESVDSPVDRSVDFIFSHPGVGSLIAGTINADHLRQNAESVSRFFERQRLSGG
jgi:aryl-alcohol dehydrogenase-like predicted oxidoreductase